MALGRKPDAVAEAEGDVAGFVDAGGDAERARGFVGLGFPFVLERGGELVAEVVDVRAGREVNGLRREAAELVVGEDINRAGACVAS